MSRTADDAGREVQQLLSVAELLEEPRLARLYACIDRLGEATVGEVVDRLDVSQATVYDYVTRLVEADALEVVSETQPRQYATRRIELTVSAFGDESETANGGYTVTPALIDAVGRQTTNDDIDSFVGRHGVDGLAAALDHAVARARGETTHRSPLAAEMVLQALDPVVREHFEIGRHGESVGTVEADIGRAETDAESGSNTQL
jgi:DNA-binding transcriptional ArsR family regulator